ncbi:MAG: UrcA family protein [Novosphingobium sp.]|nr:UrcA family protein [Novosphingobium sp.]
MTKFAIFLAIAASALSTPAYAAERTPDVRVAYGDLKLAGASGRATLDQRIAAAIDASCGVDARSIVLSERRAAQRCIIAKRAEVAPARAAALSTRGAPERIAAATH